MKQIKLLRGQVALVDDEDFEYLSKWKWRASKGVNTLYVISSDPPKNEKTIRMHRIILGVTNPRVFIDHIDHDGLNNQKSNLRICSAGENRRNSRPIIGLTSKYKGVSWDKSVGRWKAQLYINGVIHFLGTFEREQDAALAYNTAATLQYGEFGLLNTIDWEELPTIETKPKKLRSSKYKGVSKHRNSWVAKYKGTRLGSFTSEEDAYEAYIETCKRCGYPKQHLKYIDAEINNPTEDD